MKIYLNITKDGINNLGITNVGTISSGTWNGNSITDDKVYDALTIIGGSIKNTAIGGDGGASTGKFTTIEAEAVKGALHPTYFYLGGEDIIKTLSKMVKFFNLLSQCNTENHVLIRARECSTAACEQISTGEFWKCVDLTPCRFNSRCMVQ